MCDQRKIARGVAALAGLLLAAAAPAAARAQTLPAPVDREALVKRVRDLEARSAFAQAAAHRADSIAAARRLGAEPTIVPVGYLRIVTTPDQVGEARVLWQQEWDEFAPILGEQARGFERGRFAYDRRIRPNEIGNQFDARWSVDFTRPVSDRRVLQAIHEVIGRAVTQGILGDSRHNLEQWTGAFPLGAPIPAADLYRQFVTAPTSLAQSCVKGSNLACWIALGEMDGSADPIATWYPAAEQRAWISRLNPGQRTMGSACVAGMNAACLQFFRQVDNSVIQPFAVPVRASLLWFALERGGAGSLDRLVASIEREGVRTDQHSAATAAGALGPATRIREHLGRAAGMDPDVLLGLWRDQVMAGRPGSSAPDQRTRANAFLWVALFAGLATRSTRWRLG